MKCTSPITFGLPSRCTTLTFLSGERAVGMLSIDLTNFHCGDKYVPIVIRPVIRGIDRDNTRRTSFVYTVEKQQLNALRSPRADGKIGAASH